MHEFELFVAGNTGNSTLAQVNLRAFCAEHLPGDHNITVVDVLDHPARAHELRVHATPMLVRLHPAPVVRIAGTLACVTTLLSLLGGLTIV